MNHPLIVLAMVTWSIIGVVATILTIGKERGPITPPLAVFVIIINALWVWGLLTVAGG